jgi:PAS domain S-box-containing protein
MKKQDKTREQLIGELAALRQRVKELEATAVAHEQAEARWRSLVENTPEKITILDRDGTVLFVNRTSPDRTVDEVIGTSVYDYLPLHEQDTVRRVLESVFQSGQTERYETVDLDDDSYESTYSVSVAPIERAGKVAAAIFIGMDITAHKHAEEALWESEGMASALLDAPTDLVSLVDTNGIIISANEAMAQRFGRPKDDLIGICGWELVPPDLARSRRVYFDQVVQSGEPRRFEDQRQGTWFDNVFYPVFDTHGKVSMIALIARDITERKRMEEQIQASLREKEVMLGEIHHRVRNNLQVICALLDLQARSTQDEQASEALRETRLRVGSMALVHEQLYRASDLAQIDFAAYLQTLASNLFQAYQMAPGRVTLNLDVDNALLEVDKAIPCGFIVNELVTNALRHAFPVDRDGENEICIAFHRTAAGECELVVRDNGVGLPVDFQFPTRETIGMLLIGAYSRELKATVAWQSDGGTTCRVVFSARAEEKAAAI